MEECEEFFYSAEICSYQIVEDLISKCADLLYDRYIESGSLRKSVVSTLSVLSSTVEAFYFRIESGEPIIWEEELEPRPSNIDTWARKAIPIKRVLAVPKIDGPINPVNPDAKSVNSHTSRRSIYGRLNKTPRNKNIMGTEAIEELILAVPIPEVPGENNEEEEIMRVRKEREIKKKKENNERVKKMKEEEDMKEKRIAKERENMKGKSFTYDFKGKILTVSPIKAENIPGFLPVRFSSQDPVVDEKKVPVKKTAKEEMHVVKRGKPTPQREQEWVKNLTSLQPPMIDLIQLSPGVAIFEGPRTKRSTESVDMRLMTRKQYNETFHSSHNQSLVYNLPIDRKLSIGSSVDSEYKQDGKKDFLESIPDYEDLKEDIQEMKSVSMSLSPVKPGHGRVVKYGNSFEANDQSGPTERFNAEIIKNKNWGLNPPIKEPIIIERLPKKSSTTDMKELFGNILKKPKDNPFITPAELWESSGPMIKKPRDRPHIERIQKKTRMPPPPYGYTMINALPELSGLANSFSSNKPLN